jgi:hypothetical protein
MRRWTLLAAVLLTACPATPAGDRIIASAVVGADGGRLEGEGVALDIPPGALNDARRITLRVVGAPPATPFQSVSPTIVLEPSGLVFARPVELSLPVAPDAEGVVLWSRLDDDASFEFAGFVSHGRAIGRNTHFSRVTTADDPSCPSGGADSACGGDCAEPEPGEALCPGGDTPDAGAPSDAGTSNRRGCLRPCSCQASDADGAGFLCPTNPRTHNSACAPPDPALLTNDDREFLAEGEGRACTGWRYVDETQPVCACMGRPAGATVDEPLCAIAWTNTATPPGVNWNCITSVADGHTRPAPPMPPEVSAFGITAFVGTSGGGCMGYPQPRGRAATSAQISGHLDGCTPPQLIRSAWRSFQGTSTACRTAPDDARRCQLTPAEWQQLQTRRTDCGYPQRATRAEERANNPEGAPDGMLVTLAILTVPNEPATGQTQELTGVSSRAQPFRRGPPMCPAEVPITQDWQNIGYAYTDSNTGLPRNDGATRSHAEGNALLQLAESRNRTPTSSGASTGTATLLVDRAPCSYTCRPGGIDAARRASGLSEVRVRSPSGCIRYADGLGPSGAPCN